MTLCIILQYNTRLYNTMQYSILHKIIQILTISYNFIQYHTVLYDNTQNYDKNNAAPWLHLARFSARLRIQDRADCGNITLHYSISYNFIQYYKKNHPISYNNIQYYIV